MESSNTKPDFKRALIIGCNDYSKVEVKNLTQARKDAQKLKDLCKENSFDNIYFFTDYNSSPGSLHPKIIESLNKLIIFAEGSAQKKDPPQYTFNFIQFSCHGVMHGNQTLAVIPFLNKETQQYEKQYVNITSYAHKLAKIKNTFNIILCDGCRNEVGSLIITENEKGTMKERSIANLLKATQEQSLGQTFPGISLVIYSTSKGQLSQENDINGGCGTHKFLEEIKENILNQLHSWEFIDSYGELEIEKISTNQRKEWKKIIIFSKWFPEQLSEQPSMMQVEEEKQTNIYELKQYEVQLNKPANLQEEEKEEQQKEVTNYKQQQVVQQPGLIAPSKQGSSTMGNNAKLSLLDVIKEAAFKNPSFDENQTEPNSDQHPHNHQTSGYLQNTLKPHINTVPTQSTAVTTSQNAKMIQLITDKGKIVKTYKHQNEGMTHSTVIRASNGNVIVGGHYDQLLLYSPELKLIKLQDIDGHLFCGIRIGNQIYCGQEGQLSIFDEDLSLLAKIKTLSTIHKMLVIDEDYILLGQEGGCIDIINLSASTKITQTQLSNKQAIWDVVKTQHENEYAFATMGGIYLATITLNQGKYSINENKQNIYLKGQWILCIQSVQNNVLVACVHGLNEIQVINTDTNVTDTIMNSDGRYKCLQKVIDYDDDHLPYLILKDGQHISLINTKTWIIIPIIKAKYKMASQQNSMEHYKYVSVIKLLTLSKPDGSSRIKEYIILQ